MKLSNEAKVGALVVLTATIAVVFASMLGVQSPFGQNLEFYLTYNFAGGIEIGSPVRVSGIKVGRVEKIDFFVPTGTAVVAIKEPGSPNDEASGKAIAPLRIKVSVRKDASPGIRQDSRFYINLAGLIGERYVEITPGTVGSKMVAQNAVLAGVDPPRIDQLISQSFDLAGKITDIIEENKGDITRSLDLVYKLSGNLNQTLKWIDKSAIFKSDLAKLVDNLIAVTQDVRKVTNKVNTPEGDKALKLLYDLLLRLEPLDEKAIRQFLQKEGVKVQMF